MKTKAFFSASYMIMLVLASMFALSFTACSSDDNEPTIDELLSNETTPVSFEMEEYYNNHFLFDYTENWKYVGTDTISLSSKKRQATIDLRQGKHQIIWVRGIEGYSYYEDYVNFNKAGVHFNPASRTFFLQSERCVIRDNPYEPELNVANGRTFYWLKELEVSPYLLPTQKVNYITVSCSLQIIVTDLPNSIEPKEYGNRIGVIRDVPVVAEVGMDNNKYKMREEPHSLHINYYSSGWTAHILTDSYCSLCPLNGMDNIQLSIDLLDGGGKTVSTILLPKFSFRRGYTTVLRGPLFSGSTSDWEVSMEPYVN